jgi:hypothetical protein
MKTLNREHGKEFKVGGKVRYGPPWGAPAEGVVVGNTDGEKLLRVRFGAKLTLCVRPEFCDPIPEAQK